MRYIAAVMQRYPKLFILSSSVYLVFSAVTGMLMVVIPGFRGLLRFSHIHGMVFGWVTMVLIGLLYHALPENRLSSIRESWLKIIFWTLHIGLAGLVLIPTLQILELISGPFFNTLAAFSAVSLFIALLLFVITLVGALR